MQDLTHIRTFRGDSGRTATVYFDRHDGQYEVQLKDGAGNDHPPEIFALDEYGEGAAGAAAAKQDAIDAAQTFVDGHPTNVEVIVRLMERAQSGPLMQAFVVEALIHYADQVVGAAADYDGGVVSMRAWKACAEEAQRTLNNHLGR